MKRLFLLLPLIGITACQPNGVVIKSGYQDGTITLHSYSKGLSEDQDDMFDFWIRQKRKAIEINSEAGYWGAVNQERDKLATLQSWQKKIPNGFVQFQVAITIKDENGKPQTELLVTSEDGHRSRYVTCLDPSLTGVERREILEATKTANPSKDFALYLAEKGSSLHSKGLPLLEDRMIDKACELYAKH